MGTRDVADPKRRACELSRATRSWRQRRRHGDARSSRQPDDAGAANGASRPSGRGRPTELQLADCSGGSHRPVLRVTWTPASPTQARCSFTDHDLSRLRRSSSPNLVRDPKNALRDGRSRSNLKHGTSAKSLVGEERLQRRRALVAQHSPTHLRLCVSRRSDHVPTATRTAPVFGSHARNHPATRASPDAPRHICTVERDVDRGAFQPHQPRRAHGPRCSHRQDLGVRRGRIKVRSAHFTLLHLMKQFDHTGISWTGSADTSSAPNRPLRFSIQGFLKYTGNVRSLFAIPR